MTAAAVAKPRTPLDVVVLGVVLGLGALVALFGAASPDPLFAIHMYVFLGAFVLGLGALVVGANNGAFRGDKSKYMDGVVRAGVIASMFWACVGLLVGVVIACQLAWPNLFYFPDFGWLNFGRLRPVHTSGVIFAFGGNVLICTSFYVVQRTCKARLFGGRSEEHTSELQSH